MDKSEVVSQAIRQHEKDCKQLGGYTEWDAPEPELCEVMDQIVILANRRQDVGAYMWWEERGKLKFAMRSPCHIRPMIERMKARQDGQPHNM